MKKAIDRLLNQAGDSDIPLDDRNVNLGELLGLFKADMNLISLDAVNRVCLLLPRSGDIVSFLMEASSSPSTILPSEAQDICVKSLLASTSNISLLRKVASLFNSYIGL